VVVSYRFDDQAAKTVGNEDDRPSQQLTRVLVRLSWNFVAEIMLGPVYIIR